MKPSIASRAFTAARRRALGLAWRLQPGRADPGAALLARLPAPARVPLQRDGLDPVPDLGRGGASAAVTALPLPFGLRGWLVCGYAEAQAVLADASSFSNDFRHLVGSSGIRADQHPGGLGFSDPPDHTRLRKLLTPHFTGHRLRALRPRIDAIVSRALDSMAAVAQRDGQVDLVEHFALPIPSLTICELLGIPYEDRAGFQRLSTARFDVLGGAAASLGAVTESLGYLQGVVERQRAEPGEGLLGRLVAEHGDEIGDDELAGIADGLLTGGLETTASMLALGALVLLRDPALTTGLRNSDEAAGPVVEELLRYLSVVQVAFPRFARRAVTVGGVGIAAGDVVLCSLSAAGRDTRLGADLERVDPARSLPGHLAFGHGLHRCVGAELARLELRAAYPALVRRFPGIRLATGPEEIAFRQLSVVYGVDALPVVLGTS